jgi:hypothetical protein
MASSPISRGSLDMNKRSSSALGMVSSRVDSSDSFCQPGEHPARFRFPVTWSYVTTPPSPVTPNPPKVQHAPRAAGVIVSSPLAAPSPVSKPAVSSPVPVALAPTPPPVKPAPPKVDLQPAAPAKARSEAQWEMVIPKMARPAPPRPPAPAIAARVPPPEAKPPDAKPSADADRASGSDVSFYTMQESLVPRRWKALIFGAAAVLAIGLIAWVRPTGSRPNSAAPSAEPGTGSWSRRTAYLIGSKDPRDIVVYDSSNGLENYRMEFGWTPEINGVGWIFRAQDSANYYAAKVALLQAGATPALSVEHFTVVRGVEGAHSRKAITLTKAAGAVAVRLDASGPTFTLYLDGNPVDYWNDSRFATGSLGFYEDRGARPFVQALRFTFEKKGGTQTVLAALQ